MVFADVIAFIKALPELVRVMGEVVSTLNKLRQDAIDKELEKIRYDVSETLTKISNAKTDADRSRLSLELATRLRK
jgi:hypothetical protein